MTIEPGPWSADAEVWLSKALGHSTIDDLKSQWEQGAALFYVRHQGATVGAFLLRVDKTERGGEGVIVAVSVEVPGIDMMNTIMASIESRFQGCKTLRFNTNNAALLRKLARIGYMPREIIAVKEINHGQ